MPLRLVFGRGSLIAMIDRLKHLSCKARLVARSPSMWSGWMRWRGMLKIPIINRAVGPHWHGPVLRRCILLLKAS